MEKLPDSEIEKGKIEPGEKKSLGKAWTKLVVDNVDVPENMESFSQEKIKGWLFNTLMEDTERLAGEWGLNPNEGLIRIIRDAKNPEERAAAEFAYIEDSQNQVEEIIKKFEKQKSFRYDSWPKAMRKGCHFNCVGAALFGIIFAKKAGIESFEGKPHSHTLNILRLSNGDWIYSDFMNSILKRIKPEETEMEGIKVLKLNDDKIDYELIPILRDQEITGSIIGNLASLKYKAEDPETEIDWREEAQNYFKSHKEIFEEVDFYKFQNIFYEDFIRLKGNPEIREEGKIIDILFKGEEEFQKYLKSLPQEILKQLKGEIKGKKDEIANFLLNKNRTIFKNMSPELAQGLEILSSGFEDFKNDDLYTKAIERLARRIGGI